MAPRKSPAPKRRRSAAARASFRQALVEQAQALMRSAGSEAVTIRAVTEPLGVSQMAFYTYFESRTELLRAVWSECVGELHQDLLTAPAPEASPREVLRAHVETFIRYWEQNPDLYRTVYNPALSIESTPETQRAYPVYYEMVELGRQRVAAVIGAKPHDAAVLTLGEQIFTKAVGYLHTMLVLRRYPIADPARLRAWVIDDIVEGVVRHGGVPAATRKRKQS
ncbi:TetR/AcrR family transcriptional regulator [Rubrivivax gelatinosus]|uniref:TetR family transcriptional regulator n=1 Tax=Rubrivivax gelatinosus TaxID=28068 RepID=A0A4R2M9X8_RUBGE|nr:TetR/AcrR family transcriptional regulator [Rubrivivax gelatinosus]MBK1689665.1 TetR family transcriptional regulator [Rubrivivax gelatinosus]TCP01805.1 TetR family transcriptional regulator [Rubrivivax gelatinosus]